MAAKPLETPRGAAPTGTAGGDDVSDPVLEQAVAWYVRRASGSPPADGSADQHAFEAWLRLDPEHERAWHRLQGLLEPLRATRPVPAAMARSTLTRAEAHASRARKSHGRRRLLQSALWIGPAGALLLWQTRAVWREQWTVMAAGESTGTGERRSLALDDGTRLDLNTATSVDVRFSDTLRQIVLHRGEIQVITARSDDPRPFEVRTLDGRMRPVGTRFLVRRGDDLDAPGESGTRLAVTEGAVDVFAASDPESVAIRVAAGRGLRFSHARVGSPEPAPGGADAWVGGFLVAQRMPLHELIAEIGRHRRGVVRCDPAVADLPVTGTWPLDGDDPTGRILSSLERVLPVRIGRLSRYWVTVGPL